MSGAGMKDILAPFAEEHPDEYVKCHRCGRYAKKIGDTSTWCPACYHWGKPNSDDMSIHFECHMRLIHWVVLMESKLDKMVKEMEADKDYGMNLALHIINEVRNDLKDIRDAVNEPDAITKVENKIKATISQENPICQLCGTDHTNSDYSALKISDVLKLAMDGPSIRCREYAAEFIRENAEKYMDGYFNAKND